MVVIISAWWVQGADSRLISSAILCSRLCRLGQTKQGGKVCFAFSCVESSVAISSLSPCFSDVECLCIRFFYCTPHSTPGLILQSLHMFDCLTVTNIFPLFDLVIGIVIAENLANPTGCCRCARTHWQDEARVATIPRRGHVIVTVISTHLGYDVSFHVYHDSASDQLRDHKTIRHRACDNLPDVCGVREDVELGRPVTNSCAASFPPESTVEAREHCSRNSGAPRTFWAFSQLQDHQFPRTSRHF